jgi:hypothetical protein
MIKAALLNKCRLIEETRTPAKVQRVSSSLAVETTGRAGENGINSSVVG